MNYRFSPHALARINERRVLNEWLDDVLTNPQQILVGQYGREIRQSTFIRDEKPWLLRVVIEGDLVLTALLTSKLDKYGAKNED